MSRLETQGNDTLNTDLITIEKGNLVVGGNTQIERVITPSIEDVGVYKEDVETGFDIITEELNDSEYETPVKVASNVKISPFESFEDSSLIPNITPNDYEMYAYKVADGVIVFQVKDGDRYYFSYIDKYLSNVNVLSGHLENTTLSGLVQHKPVNVFVPFMQVVTEDNFDITNYPVAPLGFICWYSNIEEDSWGFYVSDGTKWVTINEM